MEVDNSNLPVLLDSGDLQLLVTFSNQSLTWLGCSSSLSLGSPVWNKFLNPPFPKLVSKEAGDDDTQHKKIDFSEDSGEALLILFRIAHCQFRKIPSILEFKSILDVAVLCDKYDCVGLVKPWLALWLAREKTEYEEPGHEEWLYIAWVFGLEDIFQAWAIRLVKEMTTNDKGDCLTSTGEIFPSQMPPDIIEHMMIIRLITIKGLLKVAYDHFDIFLMGDKSVCCHTVNSKECDAIVCGSLVIGLHAIGLWPTKSADTINISARDLASKLDSLRIWKYPTLKYHYRCSELGLRDQIASMLSSISNPVLESHRRHMQIQGMK